MATPLDTGLLGSFSVIFPFLLVFCVVYAVLAKSKIIGENKALGAVIALVLAALSIMFPVVRDSVQLMAPWFVFLAFGLFFIMLMFMIFGFSEGDIMGVLRNPKFDYINVWVIGIGLVIFIGSLVSVVSEHGGVGKADGTATATETGEPATQENAFWDTITHPKVLGLMLILLIAAFTVSRLASPT